MMAGIPTLRKPPATLVDALRERARERPGEQAYTFLLDGEAEGACWTWGELDRTARVIAGRLQQVAVPGDRALLLYPPGLDFIAAFLACLYAGVLAVPAYPPRGRRPLARLGSILESARPVLALTVEAQVSSVRRALEPAGDAAPAEILATDGSGGEVDAWRDPGLTPETLAFLQYTSGSTADPKGVMVSHANLLHNEEMIGRAFGQFALSQPVVVGWLPLYHDMGLIGNVLQPLILGAPCVLMAPMAFLQKPVRWLRAISRYRATTSGGPNFAYEQCLQKISEKDRGELDLSSWTMAFNGAEPVRARTLDRFAEAFAACGFSRRSFYPCYGLAEATLFVAGGERTVEPVVARLDAGSLEQGRAVVAEDAAEGAERILVGCGRPWLGQEAAIVDPATGQRLGESRVGEIWIAGASVAGGYWRQPEETGRVFGQRLAGSPHEFFRTGDLGFSHGGELFVTGRLKDLIILRGRNHYPQDVELTVENAHPAVRSGCAAAFAVDRDGEERLVVACELDRRLLAEAEAAAAAIRQAIAAEHEVQVAEIALLRPGGVPKTSSGKVRRRACRDAHLSGQLPVVALSDLAAMAEVEDEGPEVDRASLLALSAAKRREALIGYLARRAARAARVAPVPLGPGDSLQAMGVDSLAAAELKDDLARRLGVALPIAALLGDSSLEQLAGEVAARLAEDPPPASAELRAGAGGSGEHPLSFGQRALWFLEQLARGSAAYHLATAVEIEALEEPAMERALQALADRHPALRTTFPASDGEPVARVHDRLRIGFDIDAGSALPLADRLRAAARQPFDLENGPLLRATVFPGLAGQSTMVLALHHLVADFWSLTTFGRELGALYAQETGGPAAVLDPLPLSYADFVHWQRLRLAADSPESERLWGFWRERLGGELPELDLPADRPRPSVQTFRGVSRSLWLSPPVAEGLQALGARRSTTLFMTLLAGFQAFLHRYTGQRDLLVGSPTSGRGPRQLQDLIGYFVNPVVLRADLSEEPTVAELLARTRDTVLAAFEHQDYPFPLLVERLAPEREASRSPLFQAMFVLETTPAKGANLASAALGEAGRVTDLKGLTVRSLPLDRGAALFDLTFLATFAEGELHGALEGNLDLLDSATVQRMAGHLATLLSAMADGAGRSVSHLPLLSAAQRLQMLVEWGVTRPSGRASGSTLHQLFEWRVAKGPEAIALVHGGRRLSYRELDRRADELAGRLRRHGVGPEVTVTVCAERSPELVVGLLAVLKAGGAYVPLDPDYPRERLAFILENAQCGVRAPVLLCQRRLRNRLPRSEAAARRLWLDERPPEGSAREASRAAPHEGGQLAYVIYTSGSTGRPKGVAIEHRSAVALVEWATEAFTQDELAAVLASTSICFDLSIFELFVPLAVGGTLILAENALELPALAAAGRVTLVNTVPSAIAELVRLGGLPPAVRTVNLAGEPLKGDLVRRIYRQATVERVLNLYGPSEDTTYSTWTAVPRATGLEPTIGRPVAGGRAYVTDRRLRGVPVGVPGELWLGGAGVARGYLHRKARTAQGFVPDPFGPGTGAAAPGDRLYRTGDLARFLPDGELEFLGRLDHQVKVRGFRIELGEIEAVLETHPAVAEAVAVVSTEDDPQVIAYVAGERELSPQVDELRLFIADKLPGYMVPAVFMILEEMPRTPNGKVDRRRLPDPRRQAPDAEQDPSGRSAGTASGSPLEELLAGLWSDVLGHGDFGPDDNFFALGGHSLLATRVCARLRQALDVELPLSAVFEAPTIATLARRVEHERGRSVLPPIEPLARVAGRPAEAVPLSFAQERFFILDQLEPGTPLYNLPAALSLRGPLDVAALARSFGILLARHEALRTMLEIRAGEPEQRIVATLSWTLPIIDLERLRAADRESATRRLSDAESRRPMNLIGGPLLRVSLLRLAAEASRLLITVHHAVADGWSLEVFLRELVACYQAFVEGHRPQLAPLALQYADVAMWQRRWLSRDSARSQVAYWEERLGEAPPRLTLPADRPRRAGVLSSRGATRHRRLPHALGARLAAFCRHHDATVFMGLAAAFAVLLARLTGARDLTIGTPVANRRRLETESLIGCFVNTLVLRCDLATRPSFETLLARLRRETLAALLNQDVPFEHLVERLSPERSLAGHPLFQVMLTLQNAPETMTGAEVSFEPSELDPGVAKFELTWVAERRPSGLAIVAEHSAALFDRSTIDRWLGHFEVLLTGSLDRPAAPVEGLPILDLRQRHQLLWEWNDTTSRVATEPVHRSVARQAQRTPDRPAVISRDGDLSFVELMGAAGRLARELEACGVDSGELVGLCLDRSPAMAAGLLGTLCIGAAYLPLSPDLPRDRLAYLLRDARVAAVVTREDLLPIVAGVASEAACPLIRFDLDAPGGSGEPEDVPLAPVRGDEVAYVLYTSGSTGLPKGVAVPHRALAHLAGAAAEAYGISASDRVLQFAPLVFDVTAEELFPTWLGGAAAVLWDESRDLEPKGFLEWAERRGITVMNLPGSFWHEVASSVAAGEALLPGSLRLMVTGSEAVSMEHLDRWRRAVGDRVAWRNAYGVTEATVTSSLCGPVASAPGLASVPIGRPLGNVEILLLDRFGEPAPIGVAGEIRISGAGVARGYRDRPRPTAAAFVPDGFSPSPGARAYATGDVARTRHDGNIDFQGRLDHQVKFRGFRIELGEVEAALALHPELAEVAVVFDGDGSAEARGRGRRPRCLVAFGTPYAGAEGGPVAEEIRHFLGQRLPGYMVPAHYVALTAFPRTPSGKIDRAALIETLPDREHPAVAPGSRARTQVEELVADAWCEVLGCPQVGDDDDFFDLGGHSLLAIRVVSRLRRSLGVEVPLARFFEAPTVAGLASYVDGSSRRGRLPALPVGRAAGGRYPAAFSQERLWFLDRLTTGSAFYNLSGAFKLQGSLDAEALARSLAEVVRRHGALRTVLAFENGEVVQRVAEAASRDSEAGASQAASMAWIDLGAMPATAGEQQALRLAQASARRPFDLCRGPLLRMLLFGQGREEHLLVVIMHHIISDAWSLNLLASEVATFYNAATSGRETPNLQLPLQYADYARWQRQWLRGEELASQVAYWRRSLAGAPTVLELPADRPRPAAPSFRGAFSVLTLPKELSSSLVRLSRQQDVTLFMTLVSAFEVLIGRWSGRRDFLFGTDVANRHRVETEDTIGFFVNSLVLRSDLVEHESFIQLLARVKGSALEAFARQDLPFHKLVEELQPEREASRNPLFQVMFILQSAPPPMPRLSGVRLEPVELGERFSVFDLSVSMELKPSGVLAGTFRYSTDLFEASTIERLKRGWVNLLRQIVERPDGRLDTFDLNDEAERSRQAEERQDRRRRKLERLGKIRPKALELETATLETGTDNCI